MTSKQIYFASGRWVEMKAKECPSATTLFQLICSTACGQLLRSRFVIRRQSRWCRGEIHACRPPIIARSMWVHGHSLMSCRRQWTSKVVGFRYIPTTREQTPELSSLCQRVLSHISKSFVFVFILRLQNQHTLLLTYWLTVVLLLLVTRTTTLSNIHSVLKKNCAVLFL